MKAEKFQGFFVFSLYYENNVFILVLLGIERFSLMRVMT